MLLQLPFQAAHAQSLGVSEGGTPVYAVPFSVPPGIAGMEPKVGITYAGGGPNGPVGHGWSVMGVSTISRCGSTKAVDGIGRGVTYGTDDKLCMDGQRLIQTDAAGAPMAFPQTADTLGLSAGYREFRTEKDSYSRIRAYGIAGSAAANGPAYFKVWTKSGQIYEYGNNSNAIANAAITPQARTVVANWAVSRISDTLGNYIDFQYEQRDTAWGSGPSAGAIAGREWNLLEVRYTGNGAQVPANKLVFEYTDRPIAASDKAQDRSETYLLGAKGISIRLLKAVRSYVNSPNPTVLGPAGSAIKVKTTKLIYDNGLITNRSRVKQVIECAGVNEDKCLPPTTLNYLDGGSEAYAMNAQFKGSALSTTALYSANGSLGVTPGDFNGDGKTDFIRWSDTPSQNQLWTSNGDGSFTQVPNGNGANQFNITDQNLFKSDGCYVSLLADINGDGLVDILRYSAPTNLDGGTCSSYGPVYVYLNNGNGSFTRQPFVGPTLERALSTSIDNCLVRRLPNGFCSEPALHKGWTRGANFFLIDADGDGKLDIVTTVLPYYGNEDDPVDACATTVCTRWYRGNGDGTFTEAPTNLANKSIYAAPAKGALGGTRNVVDLNADGLSDFAALPTQYFNKSPMFRSRGDGNFDAVATGGICTNPLDFNGDGRTDCLVPSVFGASSNALSVALGDGVLQWVSGFNLTAAGQELAGTGVGFSIVDINGDGRSDILRWKDDPTKNTVYLSNGDGTFRESTTFNLKSANDQLQKSDGSAWFVSGDFTGRGAVEFLRLIASPSAASDATRNQLYVKLDTTPPDQVLSLVSGTGLTTRLTFVPLSNSASGSLGVRYTSDRGTGNAAAYPKIDVASGMYVVATSVADSGVGTSTVTTEYSYKGLKGTWDGRGSLGFRETRRHSPGANGENLTVVTQYVQGHPYIGMASTNETRRGTLDQPTAPLLSSSTYVYCDNTAAAGADAAATVAAPCPTTAKIQRPYLKTSTDTGFDLTGAALPTVTTNNTYNSFGDPLTIITTSSGTAVGLGQTFTKTTTNQYFAENTAADSWILGRLQKATQQSSVPNSLASISTTAGSAPYATATKGTGPLPPISPAVLMSILQMLLLDD